MNFIGVVSEFLLFSGLVLLVVGTFLYFVPGLLVKWNAVGNTWIGRDTSARRHARQTRRLISPDYFIFANHKVAGGLMWGISALFLAVYILYTR